MYRRGGGGCFRQNVIYIEKHSLTLFACTILSGIKFSCYSKLANKTSSSSSDVCETNFEEMILKQHPKNSFPIGRTDLNCISVYSKKI